MKLIRFSVVSALLVCCILLVSGCGGANHPPTTSAAGGDTPSMEQLESVLFAELARLGKDPDRTPSAAPSGAANCVFDLSASVSDGDGTGPNPPTGVWLEWSERCLGDYNQDGLVGVSDLTPLGQHFEETVAYYDEAHRGTAFWPVGQPQDDGGVGPGLPPAPGSPTENWRLARIDGNGDGLIGISDITTIGQHWNERLDGYRVYRIRPGETQFSWLPNPFEPSLPYTVPREAGYLSDDGLPDPHLPLYFEFYDDQLGAATGWFEYYVVPYDTTDDQEGMPHLPVPANMGGGGGSSVPPVAILQVDIASGEAPLTVVFDAGASWDPDGAAIGQPDGAPLTYRWDIDGDITTWEVDSTPDSTLQRTLSTAGTHDQWMWVSDSDHNTASAHIKVSVASAGGNLPPVAAVNGLPPDGEAPLDVTWDASASLDYDGTIVRYEWDTDGDETTWELDSGATPTYSTQYTTGGQRTQYVRVTDDGGLTDIAFGTVTVFGASVNQPPVAAIVADVTDGDAPLTVNFDASGSFDPDGTIVQYQWDFDSDITVDDTTMVPMAQFSYTEPGEYEPIVIVADDQGATGLASCSVTIHGWVTGQVDPGPNAGLYCSAAMVDGSPAIAYNWDNWPTNGDLRYIRALNSEGTLWPSSPVVVDDGGGTNYVGSWSSLAVVSGHPAIGYFDGGNIQLKYIRATDQTGAAWPAAPVVVNGTGAGQHISLALIDGHPAMSYFEMDNAALAYQRATDDIGTAWYGVTIVDAGPNVGYSSSLIEFPGSLTVPLIAHVDDSNTQVVFERATDKNGLAAWVAPTPLCQAGDAGDQVSMALVNGLPAVAFHSTANNSGLVFRRALDSTNWNWSTPNWLVAGSGLGLAPVLGVVNGRPAVAFWQSLSGMHFLMYAYATDADGSTWAHVVENVHYQSSADYYVSLIDVNGHAGIAYYDSIYGRLMFAHRY